MTTTSSQVAEVATSLNGTAGAQFERYIHPDEWATVRQVCLEEEGWIVEITVDGGIKFPDVTPEQSVEMEAAFDRCEERAPVDPKYQQPLTGEQLEFLYNWYIEESIPCMEAEGHTGFEPPSLARFIETWGTPDQWGPVDDIIDQIQGQLPSLYAQCPPGPPVDELFAS